MIQNMINSENSMNTTESTNTDIFTKVIAEERIGNFDAEYKGLDFLKGGLNLLKVQLSDDFYDELLQVSKKIQI